MKKDRQFTLREVINQYYNDEDIYEQYADEADAILNSVDKTSIKEKCKEVARQSEKKRIRIGRLCISKVACMLFVICLSIVLTGGIVYAAVLNHIRSIKVQDMGDHGEIDIEYNNVPATGEAQEKNPALEILDYYEPTWIPEGYYKETEHLHVMSYNIIYQSIDFDGDIYYSQYTSSSKHNYSTENGRSEQVSFGEYSGEYIETDDDNYLIVTDDTYIYSLIVQSGDIDKQELIKMIESIIKK
ncbi:MAG: DUF4367 domain-containing protein [Lachnospiraceae bacterium]|nr:DUF4367 domain-containing protein [Lachnospiraceae bacterium]